MESINSLLDQLPANEEASVTSFRLSVLVTVFNERHLVEASLRRVLALDHELISSLEVIVVDDGSTDGSAEVVRRLAAQDSRISFLDAERNQGKGAAIRTAIAQATGGLSIVAIGVRR
jgi:glycosyltransferase involved in cell wall biosynthesis